MREEEEEGYVPYTLVGIDSREIRSFESRVDLASGSSAMIWEGSRCPQLTLLSLRARYAAQHTVCTHGPSNKHSTSTTPSPSPSSSEANPPPSRPASAVYSPSTFLALLRPSTNILLSSFLAGERTPLSSASASWSPKRGRGGFRRLFQRGRRWCSRECGGSRPN